MSIFLSLGSYLCLSQSSLNIQLKEGEVGGLSEWGKRQISLELKGFKIIRYVMKFAENDKRLCILKVVYSEKQIYLRLYQSNWMFHWSREKSGEGLSKSGWKGKYQWNLRVIKSLDILKKAIKGCLFLEANLSPSHKKWVMAGGGTQIWFGLVCTQTSIPQLSFKDHFLQNKVPIFRDFSRNTCPFFTICWYSLENFDDFGKQTHLQGYFCTK